jgi:protein-S-isoprenylcysteine O-methyltransferase Ste14
MTLVDRLHAVTTGPRWRRSFLTPVGASIALALMALVIVGGRWTDRAFSVPPLLPGRGGRMLGAAVLLLGLALWAWCLTLFRGKGVPFNPPNELIVRGPYAWVRNPMLTGVSLALLGAGLLLHSISIVFVWTPAFVLLNFIAVKRVEEPELERRLGAEYAAYKQAVPWLLPRRPRQGPGSEQRRPSRPS